MSRLRTAVVGCGVIATARHLPAYKRLRKNVELCAVCDIDGDLASRTAEKFKIPRSYNDLSRMLSQEDLDIVDICVPPMIHAPSAIEAMEHGCHVLMEKPMALDTRACDQMIEASRRNNVKLCVVHNNLFHSPFIKARDLISSGAIGDLVGMRMLLSTPRWDMVDLQNHWYHRLPGGLISETSPHVAYMSLAFLGEIKSVDIFARSVLKYRWAPFDEFQLELEGSNANCSAILSYARNTWAAVIDLTGTEATLCLDLNTMSLVCNRLKELKSIPIAQTLLRTMVQQMGSLLSNSGKTLIGRQRLGTEVVIDRFVNSILTNADPPVTGNDGRRVVEVMQMLTRKLEEKYPQR